MKNLLKRAALLMGACAIATCSYAVVNTQKSIKMGDTNRTYILYVPDNVAEKPALVLPRR